MFVRINTLTFNYKTIIAKGTMIDADPEQLRQVFYNILSNCVRHAPHQGNIVLTADYDQETHDVCVSIADDGPGIPDNKKQAVFEKFSTDEKGKQSGVGLGLYICRCILESHDGQIWVEDNDPQGARFVFRFR